MDFSSCINFDELEEKPEIIPTKQPQRRSSIKASSAKAPPLIPSKKSQTCTSSHPILSPAPYLSQYNSQSKSPKKLQTRFLPKKTSHFFAFEGNNLRLSSLKTFSSFDISPCSLLPSKNMSPTNLRLNNKNFRRCKLNPAKLRSKSFWGENEKKQESCARGNKKNKESLRIRNRKVELLPQTKACGGKRVRVFRPELRISGVMKDFVCREGITRFKDSANATDEFLTGVC